MRRIHFEQLCFVRGNQRKNTGIGKSKRHHALAAHQRRGIIVVAQSNDIANSWETTLRARPGNVCEYFRKLGIATRTLRTASHRDVNALKPSLRTER